MGLKDAGSIPATSTEQDRLRPVDPHGPGAVLRFLVPSVPLILPLAGPAVELYDTDRQTRKLVNQAILILERNGPAEGRPLVDTIAGAKFPDLKELRPGSARRSEIRILFVFDPWRAAILLVAGDKAGNWERWYREAIPRAERLYEFYLVERHKEMDG
ncbi:type II toxin-antitoxin system RelE/ParE family toxin [Nonomuraea sp. NPDC049725]|uniref:type II toxin-antitoxin system RelE/ParE family toxin n=1 Tax=Nonomuraea sp. NPDC049725 TaxID=3154508 RepID=UPI003432E8F3